VFNLSYMAVSRNNVELNREQISMYTGELLVHMYVTHVESTMLIKLDNGFKFLQNCTLVTVDDWFDSAETNAC